MTQTDPKNPGPFLIAPEERQALIDSLKERERIRRAANLPPLDLDTTFAEEIGRLAEKNYFRLVLPYLAEADRLTPDYSDIPRSHVPRLGRYHEVRGRYAKAMTQAREALLRDTGLFLEATLADTFDEFLRLYRAGELSPLSSTTATTPRKGEENE